MDEFSILLFVEAAYVYRIMPFLSENTNPVILELKIKE